MRRDIGPWTTCVRREDEVHVMGKAEHFITNIDNLSRKFKVFPSLPVRSIPNLIVDFCVDSHRLVLHA